MMLITTLVVSFLVCCMLEDRCGVVGVVSGLQTINVVINIIVASS